jgi:hypothetical protein
MQRFLVVLATMFLAQTAMAQEAVSRADYVKLLQSSNQSVQELDTAMKAKDFHEARIDVGMLRKNFMSMRRFWSAQQRTDAVRVVGEGLNHLTSLEELLGRPKDQVQVERAVGVIQEFRTVLAKKEIATPK